jgi:hypothetical protein
LNDYFPTVKIPPAPFAKGGGYLGFCKGGDIPRLFSDRMPERIACRQVSENSRTFPPLKKGRQGGFLFSTSPPFPPFDVGRSMFDVHFFQSIPGKNNLALMEPHPFPRFPAGFEAVLERMHFADRIGRFDEKVQRRRNPDV